MTHFADVEALKERLDERRPIELAAALHHRLTALHPFTDGNGRNARLVMNLALMHVGYAPAIIREEEREGDYAALQAADAGDYEPLTNMIEREVARTLRCMLDVIEGRTALNEADLGRRFETFARRSSMSSSYAR